MKKNYNTFSVHVYTTNDVTISLFRFAESNAGELEAVRLDLQQQVVHRHLHYPLLKQEGSLRGENPQVSSHNLFPRVRRWVSSRKSTLVLRYTLLSTSLRLKWIAHERETWVAKQERIVQSHSKMIENQRPSCWNIQLWSANSLIARILRPIQVNLRSYIMHMHKGLDQSRV